MKGNFDTDYGKVVIDETVIAKIAGLAALECAGIVGMGALSKRDGVIKLLARKSVTRGLKVEIDHNEIILEFHVIVAAGVSIPTIAQNLMETVRYQVESATGFSVKNISMYVEGVRMID